MFKWMKDKFNKLTGKDVQEDIEDKIEEVKEETQEVIDEVEDKLEISLENLKEEVQDSSDERISEEEAEENPEEEIQEEQPLVEEEVIESPKEEVIDVLEEVEVEETDNILEKPEEDVEKIELEEVKEALEEVQEDETVEDKPEAEEKEDKEEKLGFFAKLKKGLSKTRDNFTNQIDSILKSYQKIDEELFEEIEEVLITADVGIETTMDLIDNLQDRVREEKVKDPQEVMGLLKKEIIEMMDGAVLDNELNIKPSPAVVLVVGVNGVGKTTTIGKMANRFKQDGNKVLIAAGDTFRAAAIEQLEEWGHRAGVDIISHSEGADPAAVIFDGVQAAKARKADILICDTAGRLHNKSNLMQELNKIFRVLDKEYPEATKEVLLVLDATTGQNAMSQAREFKEVANITGIALTKLDGTAKGGVVLALQSELNIPVKLVGVGEGIDDLQPFNTHDFIEAIFERD